jgi:hypothetical protein
MYVYIFKQAFENRVVLNKCYSICLVIIGGYAMLKRFNLPDCPIETALIMMGDRWKVLIVWELLTGTKRLGQLRKGLTGISEKVLTDHLRITEPRAALTAKHMQTCYATYHPYTIFNLIIFHSFII